MRETIVTTLFYNLVGRTGLNPLEAKRFVKFSIVGVMGAIVDFGSFNLLLTLFGAAGSQIGRETEIASVISFLLAISSNFIWNRYWTYPDSRSKPLVRQFTQFFLVNALAIFIRLPVVSLTHDPLGRLVGNLLPTLDPGLAIRIGDNLSLAIAVGIAMFWNFFVNRYWTYNDVGKEA